MHLPLIGEGRDGEFPARDLLCCHSEQRSRAQRDSESLTPLPMRHSGLRAGIPCEFRRF